MKPNGLNTRGRDQAFHRFADVIEAASGHDANINFLIYQGFFNNKGF
jgi:hypothetical protein